MNVHVSDDIKAVIDWELQHGNEVDRVYYPDGEPAVMMRHPVKQWLDGKPRDVPETCKWCEFRDPHYDESEWSAGFESTDSGHKVGGPLK